MSVPKLRFKADDGSEFPEWEENVLREYLSFKNGLNVEKNKFGRGVKMIGVLDILNNDYIVYDMIRSEVNVGENVLKEFAVEFGDILFQRSSETREDAGKSNVYLDKDRTATFGGFVIRGKKVGEYEPRFINIDFKSAFIRRQIIRVAQGDQHVNISQEMLSDIRIFMPTMNEQNKIANLFSRLDYIIKQIQSELEAWEKQKRGVMQLLFSRMVRFKADDGSEFPEWEAKTFKEIATYFSGGTPRAGREEFYNGSIPFIRSGELHSDMTELYLSEAGLNNSSAKIVEIGDVLYALYGATSGDVSISKINGAINQAILCIRPYRNYNKQFIVFVLEYHKGDILNKFLQGGQGNLSAEIIKSLRIEFPCIEEQQKIVACLLAFDDVIGKTKKELDAYRELKKGLLQQMFV